MNGDSNEDRPLGLSSSYLKTSLSSSYGNSPRLKRLDEMKKSYLSTGGPPPNSGYNSTNLSSFTSKYGTSAGTSYRLASLDRLAYRHKLYEANSIGTPTEITVNGTSPANGYTNGSHNGTASNITSITTTTTSVLPSLRDNKENCQQPSISEVQATPHGVYNHPSSSANLQSKREMFFKSDSTGGSVTGPTQTLTHPSTAPPAPPVSTTSTHTPTVNGVNNSNSHSSPPPTNTTNGTSNHSTVSQTNSIGSIPATTVPPISTSNNTSSSVASIKEQLLTSKEKEKKNEMLKEEDQKEKVIKRRPREVDGYVGFVNLPNQVYRKAVKRGFEFSLMVVGGSGLGKSTLINSMFLTDIYSNEYPGPSHRVKKTVQVETTKTLLKENGVNLSLTIVDTPGFGDAVDNSDCWQPVIDYIESKYEDYLNAESKVNRKQISDNRVHCCLYFIAPSGHGLKSLDVEFMRRLHDKVNIIPVIAKADSLTPEECQHLKKQILNEINQHKIKIYEFPDDDGDGVTLKMKSRVPYAVVGSNITMEVDGKKVRGRKYPWGVVEVENMEHCDFIPLRNMMIRTHMQDLKDVTNSVHYENFRCRKLAGVGGGGGVDAKIKTSNKNPITQLEEEKREHSNRMKKLEADMQQVFEMKVKEKMNKLKDLEDDLQKRNETMRKKLETDFAELDEERERFMKEKKAWEAANNITVEELRRRSLESISREQVDGKKKKKGLF